MSKSKFPALVEKSKHLISETNIPTWQQCVRNDSGCVLQKGRTHSLVCHSLTIPHCFTPVQFTALLLTWTMSLSLLRSSQVASSYLQSPGLLCFSIQSPNMLSHNWNSFSQESSLEVLPLQEAISGFLHSNASFEFLFYIYLAQKRSTCYRALLMVSTQSTEALLVQLFMFASFLANC